MKTRNHFFVLTLFCYVINLDALNCQNQAPDLATIAMQYAPDPPDHTFEDINAMSEKFTISANEYNGQVGVTIPLANLAISDYTIDLSLNYSPGVKIRSVSSYLGTGWNLQYGGVISRQVRDESDFVPDINQSQCGMLNYPEPRRFIVSLANNSQGTCDFSYSPPLNNGQEYHLDYNDLVKPHNLIDSEPDIFTLSIPGLNVRFVYRGQNSVIFESDRSIRIIQRPYEEDGSWIIQTDDGVKYFFGTDANARAKSNLGSGLLTSAWYLSKVEVPSGKTIVFSYVKNNLNVGCPLCKDGSFITFAHVFANEPDELISPSGVVSNEVVRPTGLSFDNGDVIYKINLSYESNRSDLEFYELKSIEKEVYDIESQTTYKLFRCEFNYDFDPNRLWLKELVFSGFNSDSQQWQTKPGFKFEYYSTEFLPSRDSHGMDHWGYYNGHDENQGLFSLIDPFGQHHPMFTSVSADFHGDRSTNPGTMHYGSLKSMTTPLGLKSTFEYEPHEFLLGGADRTGGGIRVSKVIKQDVNSGLTQTDYYTYLKDPFDLNSKSSGIIMQSPQFVYYYPVDHRTIDVTKTTMYLVANIAITSDNLFASANSAQGELVGYSKVCVSNQSDFSNGCTILEFSNNAEERQGQGYWQGMTELRAYSEVGTPVSVEFRHAIPSRTSKATNGQLIRQTVYKSENGQMKPQMKKENTYSAVKSKDFQGFKLSAYYTPQFSGDILASSAGHGLCAYYQLCNYDDYLTYNYLKETKTVIYGEDELALVWTEKFEYTEKGLLQSKTLVYDGLENESVQTSYINNSYNINNTPSSALLALNMNRPVGYTTSKGGNVLESTLMAYDEKGNLTRQYRKNEDQTGTCGDANVPEGYERLLTNSYDASSNLISKKVEGDVMVSYQYDLNIYPSAECKNASSEEILYVGFENSDQNGLPLGEENVISQSEAYTGQSSAELRSAYYTQGSPNVGFESRFQNVLSSRKYKLSFWAKTSAVYQDGMARVNMHVCQDGANTSVSPLNTFSQQQLAIPNTNGKWQLFSVEIDLGSALAGIMNSSSYGIRFYIENNQLDQNASLYIDDVRFQPSDALMQTTALDASGRIWATIDATDSKIEYFYDAFGRLLYTKDQFGNITKTIDYHYQND